MSLDHSQVQVQITNENTTGTTIMGAPPVPQPDIAPSTTTTTAISTTSTTGFVDSSNTHPVVTNTETEEEALQKKRTALAGQWRTPPTPFFTSGIGTSNIHIGTSSIDSNSTSYDSNSLVTTTVASLPTTTTTTTTSATGMTVAIVPPILLEDDDVLAAPPTSLPHSAEDYAKALQEAYRRGAEAAARAAAVAVQQQPPPPPQPSPSPMIHVASCPDLVPLATTTTTTDILPPPPMINMASTSSIHPMSMSAPAASSTSTTTTMGTLRNTASTGLVVDSTTYTVPVQESSSSPPPPQPMQVQVVHHHHHHHILPAPPNNNNSTTPSVDTTDVGSVTMMIPTTSTTMMTSSSSSSSSNVALPMNTDTPNMVISTSHPPPATTLHQPSTDMTGITAATTTTSSSSSKPNTIPTPMVTTSTTSKQQQQQQQRSVSLPDMSSYAAQQEDEKRQKRLARNRASARLRRLRKKNLVDAYEVEVGHLEKTMAQLQQHEWGCTNSSHTTGVQSATVLAEALSMDRGQQKLSVAERNKAATDILQQQLQFLQQLEDLMQEQYVLQQVAQFTLNGSGNENMNEWKDLQDTLQLSPDQCQQIMDQSTGWDDEWQALQTVKSSLIAMRDNDWLWNEGCASITDQFMSILHSNQISKLLLWADHNAETIEELDSVHAINIVPNTPVFQFGMDNNPNEYMDDERMAA